MLIQCSIKIHKLIVKMGKHIPTSVLSHVIKLFPIKTHLKFWDIKEQFFQGVPLKPHLYLIPSCTVQVFQAGLQIWNLMVPCVMVLGLDTNLVCISILHYISPYTIESDTFTRDAVARL